MINILEQQGKEIEKILKTMGVNCTLVEWNCNNLVDKFEFNLRDLNEFKQIKKAVEIMKICMHKEISQTNNTNYHFAIEIKKDNKLLNLLDYNDRFNKENSLSAFLGINNNNEPIIFDLKKSIHTLISGATGMGKTSILNNIIYELSSKNNKDNLQMYLIDMKKTLYLWEGLPNIMNKPISNASDALDILENVSKIMDKRLDILAKKKKSNADIGSFPYIVVIIDELSDLMLSGLKKYIENEITHIAQLGRAVNVSLIIATQNPIVKVCTSLIKANCPTRIALKTVSSSDSINILGNKHAFELTGVGNAIIRSAVDATEREFKACFLEENNIKEYIKQRSM